MNLRLFIDVHGTQPAAVRTPSASARLTAYRRLTGLNDAASWACRLVDPGFAKSPVFELTKMQISANPAFLS